MSIFIFDLESCEVFNIPVGLIEVHNGKYTQALADDTWVVLSVYGIQKMISSDPQITQLMMY